jgi:hypothetical protein
MCLAVKYRCKHGVSSSPQWNRICPGKAVLKVHSPIFIIFNLFSIHFQLSIEFIDRGSSCRNRGCSFVLIFSGAVALMILGSLLHCLDIPMPRQNVIHCTDRLRNLFQKTVNCFRGWTTFHEIFDEDCACADPVFLRPAFSFWQVVLLQLFLCQQFFFGARDDNWFRHAHTPQSRENCGCNTGCEWSRFLWNNNKCF